MVLCMVPEYNRVIIVGSECVGLGGDAFGRAPVARWEPPETARLEQIQLSLRVCFGHAGEPTGRPPAAFLDGRRFSRWPEHGFRKAENIEDALNSELLSSHAATEVTPTRAARRPLFRHPRARFPSY